MYYILALTISRFVGVQFCEKDGTSKIALVSETWLTPCKKEAFWPPYKFLDRYNKALKGHEEPKEWNFYPVEKIYFDCGNA